MAVCFRFWTAAEPMFGILPFLVELDWAPIITCLSIFVCFRLHQARARCRAGALVRIRGNEQGFERETGIETVDGEADCPD